MNEQQHYNASKEWAKALYAKTLNGIRDIALETDVDEDSLKKWIEEENWESRVQKRSKLLLNGMYYKLELLHRRIKESGNKGTNIKDIEKYLACVAAIKNFQTQISIAEIIEYSQPFITWLRCKDPAAAAKTEAHINDFIASRLAEM